MSDNSNTPVVETEQVVVEQAVEVKAVEAAPVLTGEAIAAAAAVLGVSVEELMAKLTAPAAPAAAAPKVAKPKAEKAETADKFISETDPFYLKFGITNDKGQPVSRSYVSAYIACNTRQPDGFVDQPGFTRKFAAEYFKSDAFLAECVALGIKTGSAIGRRAAADPRWNMQPKATKTKAAKTAALVVSTPVAPVSQPTDDPEAAAFANADAPVDAEPIAVDVTVNTAETRKTRRQQLAEQLAATINK